MDELPRHIMSKLGEHLDIGDRINCEIAGKLFDNIHENITYFDVTANLNINSKLSILFKKMRRLRNLVIHYRNYSDDVVFIDPNLIPTKCKIWINIDNCDQVEKILYKLQYIEIYHLNISMSPQCIINDEPYVKVNTMSILLWKNQLNVLLYPEFMKKCTNLVINMPSDDDALIETAFLNSLSTLCITTCKLKMITDFDNVTHLIIPKLSKGLSSKISANKMDQIWLWNIVPEKFTCINYSLFKLIENLPRNINYFIYANNHPFMISILQILINDYGANVTIFYDSRTSYLVSKMINLVVVSKISVMNVNESYLYKCGCKKFIPDTTLVNANNKKEIWDQLSDIDRLIWFSYFC